MPRTQTQARLPASAKKSRSRAASPPAVKQRTPLSDRNLWIYFLLLLTTIAVYAQVRHFDFVNYDDPEYVTANPHVRDGLTPSAVSWSITSTDAANWFPLTRMSHLLDVQLFGFDSGLHHLTNLLFHLLSTLLLFAFLYRATKARAPSAFVAFVFALHPLHVESVAWVAERKDVLSAFFWMLSLWFYVRYAERPSPGRYLLTLASFSLGLLTKPMVVSLPFVLLLLDFWPLRRFDAPVSKRAQLFREKIPFFALAAAVAIVTIIAQSGSRAIKPFALSLRIEDALVSYVVYIGKTFWPTRLAVFYPYPKSIPLWEPLGAGLLLIAVSIIVFRMLRVRPYLAVGWLWYLGTLAPVIGIVQAGAQARADRYTYLPMIGILTMLAWGGAEVARHRPASRISISVLAVAACGACALLSFLQLRYWRNSETLFAHALEVTQGNYVAQHNLGLAIVDQPGRWGEAVAHYRAALEIQPESVEARTDLGTALAKASRFEEAITEYQTALRLAPDCAICRNNLQLARAQMAQALFEKAVALQKSGQPEQAADQFRAVLRIDPSNAEAHNDLGVALSSMGRPADAVREFREALRLKPDYEDARYNLEAALKQSASRRP